MTYILFNVTDTENVVEIPVKLCRRDHPMTPDNVVKNGRNKACKTCRDIRTKAWESVNAERMRETRRRSAEKSRRSKGSLPGNANARKTHCPQGHEYTDENTYRFGPDGRYRICRACRAGHNKASYRRHRDERLAWHKAHRAANPEVGIEYARRWREANRERANLLSRIKKQRRRAAGTLTVADWELVLDVYGRACLACGKPGVTIDHIVPTSEGGLNVISNVQPLCGPCNSSKSTQTIDYRPEPWADVAEHAA